MSHVHRLAGLLPPQIIRWLGRAQFTRPWLARFLRWGTAGIVHGEGVMVYGVGRGLKFDSQGGHPGFVLGTSDPLEQQALADHLKPGGVFYDIGANVGFFSTLGGRLVGDTGRVYAFEPFPESARIARANAARNGFDHVEVIEAAVCDQDGMGEFVLSSAATNYHLAKPGEVNAGGCRRTAVETVTVDGLVASGRTVPPTVVMIDAEGAELTVLRGMAETVRRHRPVIVCEVHWQPPAEFIAACRQVVGGPEIYEITRLDGEPIPATPERFHLLFQPTVDATAKAKTS